MTNQKLMLTLSLLALCCTTHAQQNTDLKKIDSVVQHLYKGLSFDDGEWKDAAKIETFFAADSRLIANFGTAPQIWTVAQYIEGVRNNIAKQGVKAVDEKEIFSETDIFGKVAQRLSTYEIRFSFKDKEATRKGINLIQLIYVDGKWKVNSIIWDRESDQLKIPSRYMPN
ncbi:hypothetical protein [Chryseolinea sp. H1M3-3]|uniref:hypothetical protein n=1 Tax=Chryseolinea sp. H1M3-3 TaxID=3034144 RepID=UPI0023EAFFA6|nr:hypothetical protein [Chryseolinea sp. H1M3-3]